MEGVFLTREFERVYRRSDSKLKQRLSKWTNLLCGKGITRKSFPNSKFILVDADEGLTVVIVMKDKFALIVNGIGNSVTPDQQCFKLSSRMKTLFGNLKIQEKGLYKSVKLENELEKALAKNEFIHIPRQAMIENCQYLSGEQET